MNEPAKAGERRGMNQVAGGLAVFFGFALAFFAVIGLMLIGLLGAAAGASASLGSERKNLRHCGESCARLATMQAVMRSTSGISELQSRNASGWHACCSSSV